MKNKIRNLAISVLAAGSMMLSSTPVNASYSYEKPETNGIEQKIDKEYGKPIKIRVIEVSGKDSLRDVVEDKTREITYEDGTIVTYHGDYDDSKTVERRVDGKKITERMEKYKSKWKIHDRKVEYERDGTKITEDFWLNSANTDIELHSIKVEKPTKDGKTVEWYWGNKYLKGEAPDAVDIITETVIYPKGTKLKESREYYNKQNEGLDGKEFFEDKLYTSIERKYIEEKNLDGLVTRRAFETILTDFDGKTEKRIEQDFEIFKRPICDGKIDFRQSIQQKYDGVREKIDYDGDGVADEEITKKITTIYLE